MARDIVERLRDEVAYTGATVTAARPGCGCMMCHRHRLAADALAVVVQLQEALTEIRDEPKGTWHGEFYDKAVPSKDYYRSVIAWCQDRAARALDGEAGHA